MCELGGDVGGLGDYSYIPGIAPGILICVGAAVVVVARDGDGVMGPRV